MTTVILPLDASIISLNKIPEIIESSYGQLLLVMPEGTSQITYVVGVVGTREHALVVLSNAETTINQIKGLGVIATEAETKLQEAIEAFNSGNYAQAETLGYEAKDLAVQTNQTATQSLTRINEAFGEIDKAENEGRTLGLNEARDLLDQANGAYAEGDYEQALTLANQSKDKAEKAERPLPLEIVGVVLAAIFFISLSIFGLRKKRSAPKPREETRTIDVQRIYKRYDLRDEEMQAIQFLADNNGQAFEAELYQNLDLPRTTTWRMVRRLEKMEIINIIKFRKQNLINIKKRFEIKK
jgi:uncharacterized membrane protein